MALSMCNPNIRSILDIWLSLTSGRIIQVFVIAVVTVTLQTRFAHL